MLSVFFARDEACSRTELAIFPEIWGQFYRASANNVEVTTAGDHICKAVGARLFCFGNGESELATTEITHTIPTAPHERLQEYVGQSLRGRFPAEWQDLNTHL